MPGDFQRGVVLFEYWSDTMNKTFSEKESLSFLVYGAVFVPWFHDMEYLGHEPTKTPRTSSWVRFPFLRRLVPTSELPWGVSSAPPWLRADTGIWSGGLLVGSPQEYSDYCPHGETHRADPELTGRIIYSSKPVNISESPGWAGEVWITLLDLLPSRSTPVNINVYIYLGKILDAWESYLQLLQITVIWAL